MCLQDKRQLVDCCFHGVDIPQSSLMHWKGNNLTRVNGSGSCPASYLNTPMALVPIQHSSFDKYIGIMGMNELYCSEESWLISILTTPCSSPIGQLNFDMIWDRPPCPESSNAGGDIIIERFSIWAASKIQPVSWTSKNSFPTHHLALCTTASYLSSLSPHSLTSTNHICPEIGAQSLFFQLPSPQSTYWCP